MDWVQIGSAFGIPVLMLFGIAIFVTRNVWPFIVSQIASSQADRRKEREEFLAALSRRDEQFEKMSKAFDALVMSLQQVREHNQRRGA